MKCPGPKCNFGLCLACITDKKTLKDPRGHPLTKIKDREERRLACDFCGKFIKLWNFGICQDHICILEIFLLRLEFGETMNFTAHFEGW